MQQTTIPVPEPVILQQQPSLTPELGVLQPKTINLQGGDIRSNSRDIAMEASALQTLKLKGIKADVLDYAPTNSLDDMLKGADVLISSGILPSKYTEPQQVIVATKMGAELGIPAMVAINNIHIIEGRPTFNVHMVGALMIRGGWTFEAIEDAVLTENSDTRTTIRFTDMNALKRWADEIKATVKYPADIRPALLEVTRELQHTIHRNFSFTWSEAHAMELLGKSNWKKMPKIMLRSRTLTLGSRFVGPALMMGMMETTEWADTKNIEYTVDEDGIAYTE